MREASPVREVAEALEASLVPEVAGAQAASLVPEAAEAQEASLVPEVAEAAVLAVRQVPPAPAESGASNNDGVFTRDYDATDRCPPGAIHVWSTWEWEAETPGATHIDFTVAVADSLAGLETAPEVPLRFSAPEGPTSLVGAAIGAEAGTPDTQSGSANVNQTLALAGLQQGSKFLRVRSYLNGEPPLFTETPILKHWNLSISCKDSE